MTMIGRFIVFTAFIFGAYFTALDPQTVNWPVFLAVVAVGVIGIVLVKRAEAAAAQDQDKLSESQTALKESLDTIIQSLQSLDREKATIPTYDMRFKIDEMLRDDLFTFADNRDAMKVLFGLESYADIMSSFAAGERYINRVWSASTDGYVDEVILYVEKSLAMFEEAKTRFEAAQP